MHAELSSPEKSLPESNIERTGLLQLCPEIFACSEICELARSSCTEHRFFLETRGR